MTDLEVFRLSAEALELDVDPHLMVRDQWGPAYPWNPFTNAEQRWNCVEKLLGLGCHIDFRTNQVHVLHLPSGDSIVGTDYPASEFPARALAELQRRKAHD